MDNYEYQETETIDSAIGASKIEVSKFMSKVFSYMFLALLASGFTAFIVGSTPSLLRTLIEYDATTGQFSRSILGWVVMLAPLAIVLLMSTRMQKMSSQALLLSFLAFSVLLGASISYIFVFYDMPHISLTFFISSATFGIMAVAGYTTSLDLSKMGSILYMALVGLIIAMVANWFMQSPQISYLISGIGVLIFTGLAAYDTQKLKHMAIQVGSQGELASKMIIMGALTLYLDFINLFLFMLRFMGGRD